MENTLRLMELREGEEQMASELIGRCFDEFIAPGYCQEGIKVFREFTAPEAIKNRLQGGIGFMVAAWEEDKLAGIIELRDCEHISLLFTDKAFHRRGIARKLYERALEKCRELKPELCAITVNSSPYAVEIYERLGFVKTDSEQERNGIRYTPMGAQVSSR